MSWVDVVKQTKKVLNINIDDDNAKRKRKSLNIYINDNIIIGMSKNWEKHEHSDWGCLKKTKYDSLLSLLESCNFFTNMIFQKENDMPHTTYENYLCKIAKNNSNIVLYKEQHNKRIYLNARSIIGTSNWYEQATIAFPCKRIIPKGLFILLRNILTRTAMQNATFILLPIIMDFYCNTYLCDCSDQKVDDHVYCGEECDSNLELEYCEKKSKNDYDSYEFKDFRNIRKFKNRTKDYIFDPKY